jgi:hypothetical protein
MRLTEIAPDLAKYRRKGVLLDTNLLLLYLTGLLGHAALETFKPIRSHGFGSADFNLLALIVSRFQKVITTPHVLTELCNHADKLKGPDHDRLFGLIRSVVGKLDEHTRNSRELCERQEFIRFGLADTAICDVSKGNYLVMTVDFALYGELSRQGVDVINFNHLRTLSWSNY